MRRVFVGGAGNGAFSTGELVSVGGGGVGEGGGGGGGGGGVGVGEEGIERVAEVVWDLWLTEWVF